MALPTAANATRRAFGGRPSGALRTRNRRDDQPVVVPQTGELTTETLTAVGRLTDLDQRDVHHRGATGFEHRAELAGALTGDEHPLAGERRRHCNARVRRSRRGGGELEIGSGAGEIEHVTDGEVPGGVGEEGAQHTVGRVRRDRQRTSRTEFGEERSLHLDGTAGRCVIDRRDQLGGSLVAGTRLDGDATLPDRGHELVDRQVFGDAVGELEDLQGRGGHHDRPTGGDLGEPGVDVAPQLDELQVGPDPSQLGAATHRSTGHGGAVGQLGERRAHQHVATDPDVR